MVTISFDRTVLWADSVPSLKREFSSNWKAVKTVLPISMKLPYRIFSAPCHRRARSSVANGPSRNGPRRSNFREVPLKVEREPLQFASRMEYWWLVWTIDAPRKFNLRKVRYGRLVLSVTADLCDISSFISLLPSYQQVFMLVSLCCDVNIFHLLFSEIFYDKATAIPKLQYFF